MFVPFLLASSSAFPGTVFQRQDVSGPVITSNFQDPCIIKVDDIWYAFSGPNRNPASGSPGSNIQFATSYDFSSWNVQDGLDSLPDPGSWAADPPHVWAPDVVQLVRLPQSPFKSHRANIFQSNGQFVMYYAATLTSNTALHCVGAATASTPAGPYNPASEPLFCDRQRGGAIDPSSVLDVFTGKLYVAYKVDGNSIGNGGRCGNTVAPIVSTPIILQEVSAEDGVTLIGGGTQILTNGPDDGALVEAPALFYNGFGGEWTLYYSSGCFVDTNYRIAYATSSDIMGPYERQGTFLETGSTASDLQLPGGIDISPDGTLAVFHADTNQAWVNGDADGSPRVRAMYAARLGTGGGSGKAVSITLIG